MKFKEIITDLLPVDNFTICKSPLELQKRFLESQKKVELGHDFLEYSNYNSLKREFENLVKESRDKFEPILVLPEQEKKIIDDFIERVKVCNQLETKKEILILEMKSKLGFKHIARYIAVKSNTCLSLPAQLKMSKDLCVLSDFNKMSASNGSIKIVNGLANINDYNSYSSLIVCVDHIFPDELSYIEEYYTHLRIDELTYSSDEMVNQMLETLMRKHQMFFRINENTIVKIKQKVKNVSPRILEATLLRAKSKAEVLQKETAESFLLDEIEKMNIQTIEKDWMIEKPRYSLDDIVLDDDLRNSLKSTIEKFQIKANTRRYEFAQRFNRSNRAVALFAGESGTGKSMAAEVIAFELNRDLFRLDFSRIQSPFVGGTESLITKAFMIAEERNLVMVLDECEAFVHDREGIDNFYSQKIVNHLLNTIESYKGVLIMTTNFADKIDAAFARRIDVILEFKRPTKEQLATALEKMLSPDAPIESNFSFDSVFNDSLITFGQLRIVVERVIEIVMAHPFKKISTDEVKALVTMVCSEQNLLKKNEKRIGF